MDHNHSRRPDSQSRKTSRELNLSTPLQFLPHVGPQKALLLARLELRRIVDLLFFFPRAYQEIIPTRSLHELEADIPCSVLGTIDSVDLRTFPDGRNSFGVLIAIEGGGYLRAVWFNQAFRQQSLKRGIRLLVTGAPKPTGISWEMRHPNVVLLAPDEQPPPPNPQAIYPLTDGLQLNQLRRWIDSALDACENLVPESLPEQFRLEHQLASIQQALRWIHQPTSMTDAESARRRFIFQELLVYQLAIAWRRYRMQHEAPAISLMPTGLIHARILHRLGLKLTGDQERAVEAIGQDMGRTIPMNRLVQGDVGSGKTAVAQYAMLLAAAYRCQAALMAPTELLAIQHAQRLSQSLADSQCHVELLTGSIQGRERRELLERIALGTVDIVVGTHALLSEDVDFAKLGLVIVDEQHKFGVAQRAAMKAGVHQPHYLLLTATPIPRTLTMSVMGDMDVSTLREKPPGRAPVHTYLGKHEQKASWWSFVAKQVAQGRQGYVVVPRVVGDDRDDVMGVEQMRNELSQGPLRGVEIGLIHGGLDASTKNSTLEKFAAGQIDVLVATTVIEVGIDIPNATVMTIIDADRLGLAQLHQLRGRVSRGTTPGYVCLFAKHGATVEQDSRLAALVNTIDGFELAELDWKMRGPGNLLGTKQSGLPPFKIADLVRDAAIVETTQRIARNLIETDPDLSDPQWSRLRSQVFEKYGAMLEYGSVG